MRFFLLRSFLLVICCLLTFTLQASSLEITSFKVASQGLQLNVDRYGDTKPDAGHRPLLLVHGLTYSSHQFDLNYADYSLARFFAGQGYEVWLLDLAGYGKSDPVRDGFQVNSDTAAEDIAAAVRFILAHSSASKVDLLGWSWGTVTTGRFTARYPQLVNKLVLYAPIVAGLGESMVTEPVHHNTYQHAIGDFQTLGDGSLDFAKLDEQLLNTYLAGCWKYDGKGSPNGPRRDLLVSGKRRLIPTSQISVPTLIIAGDRDQYVSMELCEEAYLSLPDPHSEIYIQFGAAHAMMMEKDFYRLFRERVLQFLNK